MEKEGPKRKSLLEIRVAKLKEESDKVNKALKGDIDNIKADNKKLIRQHQINTRRIQTLEKRLLQKDLDFNQLKAELNQLKSSIRSR